MEHRHYSSKLILIFLIIFTSLILIFNLYINVIGDFSGYTELARSFINKRLYLVHTSIQEDYVLYDGKYYLHQGPTPAILLIPFVFISDLFKAPFYQSLLHVFVFLGALFICFRISKSFKYNTKDSLYLAYAFCLASVYQSISVIPISSYLSQSVGVFFVLLAIYEFLGKKRYFVIGFFSALALASRFITGLTIMFFIFEIFLNPKYRLREKFAKLASLSTPYVLMVFVLMIYNYLRFGNFLDSGYTKVTSFPTGNSLFAFSNIPMNFYYYFIKTFEVSFVENRNILISKLIPKLPFLKVVEPGTSFFVVSPIFLSVFRANFKKRIVRLSLLTILIIVTILFTYYSPGWTQVGPRYMIDVLPFLFLLLLYSIKPRQLSIKIKFVILLSSLFNFYLFLSVFL